jgi:hypothetical protein
MIEETTQNGLGNRTVAFFTTSQARSCEGADPGTAVGVCPAVLPGMPSRWHRPWRRT